MQEDEKVPDVFGHYHVLQDGIWFTPYFPFESGVCYRASFDSRPLGGHKLLEVLPLEFSFPKEMNATLTQVKQVFPSSDLLPENLLRFYVCFSNSMQRGQVKDRVSLLGSDGEPVQDVLYHAPVELWDRSMRHLTILLDPGRLKRGLGPNRKLGPPLKTGHEYLLAINSGMIDSSGRPLRESFYKTFRVTEAVRERVAVARWGIQSPAAKSHQPLVIKFPKPLDWALLRHMITIASEGGQRMDGLIAIDGGERRWSFTPKSHWPAGMHHVCIAPSLEDVCGNNLQGAFDGPFRIAGELASEETSCSIPFRIA